MTRDARATEPREVAYWCANGHHTRCSWSATATVPDLWSCRHCGQPAGTDRAHPPEPVAPQPFKTPLAYLLERRSEAECEALLSEALQGLRARRKDRGRRGHAHRPQ